MPARFYNGTDYRYGFNGKENDKVINEGAVDYGARIYDNRLGRWFSTDPLDYKYASHSPYNYCLNNPIVLIDPDGKSPEEPVVFASKNNPDDKRMFEAAKLKYYSYKKGDLVFTVFAHGKSDAMESYDDEDNYTVINTPEIFDRIMMEKSEAYRKAREAGKKVKIILISCTTGNDLLVMPGVDPVPINNIAKDISSQPYVEAVAAPDAYVDINRSVDVVNKNGKPEAVVSDHAKILGVQTKHGKGGFNIYVGGVKKAYVPFKVMTGKRTPQVGKTVKYKPSTSMF